MEMKTDSTNIYVAAFNAFHPVHSQIQIGTIPQYFLNYPWYLKRTQCFTCIWFSLQFKDGLQECLTPTMTPGSPWETTPAAVEQPRLLDYWSLPADGSLGTDRDHEPYDCLVEVERARKHEDFKIFFDWLIQKFDLDGEYPWGAPEGDPLEDLLSFADWLVESGRGQYETEDGGGDLVGDQDANHRPENPASEGTIPDPNDNEPDHNVNAFPLVEVKLGEIRYSKTWPTDLKEFMIIHGRNS